MNVGAKSIEFNLYTNLVEVRKILLGRGSVGFSFRNMFFFFFFKGIVINVGMRI